MTRRDRATRNNLTGHAITEGFYFGRGRAPENGHGTQVTITRHGFNGIVVTTTAGTVIDNFGGTGKFWLAPLEPTAEEVAADAERVAAEAAKTAAERAARRAELATQPVPAMATWVYEAGTDNKIGYLSDAGVITFEEIAAAQAVEPAPAPAPAPVVIVPCGGKKAPGTLPAGDKYIGSYHGMTRRAAAAIAERTGATVFILSARYGLLQLSDLVDDYDLTMGDPGAVTAGRVAEQAAALGITDALVTVVAGKRYADVVTAVWPHAVRVLDGTNGMPAQMKRMAQIMRGEWAPAAATAAAAAPALFGAELVAPDATVVAQAADLVRGDVLAPGTFGELQHADPLVVTGDAVPVDQPAGRRRVHLFVHASTGGRARHLVVWADHTVDVVDRMPGLGNAPALPPVEEAEIVDGPALSWPRLVRADLLQAGDLVAPGGFGPWNRTDTISVTSGPRYLDTVAGVRRYDIAFRVNLKAGQGPETHGANRDDQYVPVLERRPALETVMVAPARGSHQAGELAAEVLEDNPGESTVHVRYVTSGTRAWVARRRIVGPAPAALEAPAGRVELQRGDVLTVSLRAGVDVSLAWRAVEGDYRVTVLQRGSAQLVERPRHFDDEAIARQHARGMVLSYMATGEQLEVSLDASRRVPALEATPSGGTALESAACPAGDSKAVAYVAGMTNTAAPATGTYITLPAGCSLAGRETLPADTVVVLARSEFWNSAYRETPALTMHIAYWGLPTQSLCSTRLIATEGTEPYEGRNGGGTRSTGRPAIAADSETAGYGYPADSDCEPCRRHFAQMTRETLPAGIRYPMIEARKAARAARTAELAEQRAAAAGDQLELTAGPTWEPPADVDHLAALAAELPDVPADLSDRTAESAAAPAPAPAATVERVPAAQLALIGEPLELAPPARRPAPAVADVVEADRSPRRRPDLHTDTLPLSDLSPYIGMGAFPDSRAPPPGRPTSTTRPAPPTPFAEGISRS